MEITYQDYLDENDKLNDSKGGHSMAEIAPVALMGMELARRGIIRVGHHRPNCDSPIENKFQHDLLKFPHDLTKITRQFPVPCSLKTYRIDFVLEKDGRRVGLECDGKEFHDQFIDCVRDEEIIRSGLIQRIIRIPGTDICYNRHEVLTILNRLEPSLWNRMIGSQENAAHPIDCSNIGFRETSTRTGYLEFIWEYLFFHEDYEVYEQDPYYCDRSSGEPGRFSKSQMVHRRDRRPTVIRFMDLKTLESKRVL